LHSSGQEALASIVLRTGIYQKANIASIATFAMFATMLASMTLTSACVSRRSEEDVVPVYRDEVARILDARCARCHAGLAPAGGWRADSHAGAVGCVPSGLSAVAGGADGGSPPVLAALERPDHASLLEPEERRVLERWVAAGAPAARSGTHPASFADPRAPESHGRVLRDRRYAPMLSAEDADACGRCHDGAPVTSPGIALAAPGATACTTCHDEPGGVLGCGTCHGSPGRLHPPRDPCFHPEAAKDRAHGAHVGPSASRADGLACSTCHPQPASGELAGTHPTHVNGHVEIWFDYAAAGNGARFDPRTRTCTGTCHSRGGARPAPTWEDAPMRCFDCHGSPPPDHYRGACATCHREANDVGTALSSPKLHVDGKVDLGDGTGRCGACHGSGDSPWPETGSHAAHRAPRAGKPVPCFTCHEEPRIGDQHPTSRGSAAVRFAGLAASGGRRATYDAERRTCSETYCHAGRAASVPVPRWGDGATSAACGACHGTPPPPPHPSGTACASCHPASSGATHVDGIVTR
jgi:predicted CxxxxCH...CXXCH cytochrome family protein